MERLCSCWHYRVVRGERDNPPLPDSLKEDYFRAIRQLAETAVTQLEQPEDIRAVLSILAIAKGLRVHAKLLLEYSKAELLEMISKL